MHAIRLNRHGGPEVLEWCEIDDPRPGAGELLVEVHAAGVNFIDIYHRTGLYPMELPLIPGQEGAGVVTAVGRDVEDFVPGDRVAWAPVTGSYAELRTIPAAKAVRVPDGVELEAAAAAMLQGMTAQYLTHSTFPLRPGHRVLIHAAAGGVGLLFIQMAKMLGARVAGTVGSDEKAELALAAGADLVIRYRDVDFAAEVRRWTDGTGVDAVFDSVGQSTFDRSLAALAPRGMLVSFGQASGPVPPLEIRRLSSGSLYITRPSLGRYVATRSELLERAGFVLDAIADGRLDIRIDSRFPIRDASDAQRRIESRESSGKILLVREA